MGPPVSDVTFFYQVGQLGPPVNNGPLLMIHYLSKGVSWGPQLLTICFFIKGGQLGPPFSDVTVFNQGGPSGPPVSDVSFFNQGGQLGLRALRKLN